MEAVELRVTGLSRAGQACSPDPCSLCLRFPDGEQVPVAESTVKRSPILSNCIAVQDDVGQSAASCGVIHVPAGLLRSWLRFVHPVEEQLKDGHNIRYELALALKGADFLCDSDGVAELCAAVAKSTAVAHFPEDYAFPMTVQLQDGHYVEVSRETVTDCLCLHNGNVRPSLPEMFRLLPLHLVTAILEHLTVYDIGEVFATIPEEFHPQVVQAYFPDVAQAQSLSLQSLLCSAGALHCCPRSQDDPVTDTVHQHILNAVAKIPDMRRLCLDAYTVPNSPPIQHFMSSGLQHLSQLTFLQFKGLLPGPLPDLGCLRTLKLHCFSPEGLSVPGLIESIASCTALQCLTLEGWMQSPLSVGAALAESLSHCSALRTLSACVWSGEIVPGGKPLHSTLFHQGLLQVAARIMHTCDRQARPVGCLQQPSELQPHPQFLQSLASLHLSRVVLSCTKHAKNISDLLGCCTSLQDLKLLRIDVHESQDTAACIAGHLAPGFRALKNLRTLEISMESMRARKEPAWMHSPSQDDLINDDSAAALSESFAQLTALGSLQFSAQCSAAGGRHLAASLRAMTCLTSLCLEHVPLSGYVPVEYDDDDDEEEFHHEPFDQAALAMLMAGHVLPDAPETDSEDMGDGEHMHAALHGAGASTSTHSIASVNSNVPEASSGGPDTGAASTADAAQAASLHAALFAGLLAPEDDFAGEVAAQCTASARTASDDAGGAEQSPADDGRAVLDAHDVGGIGAVDPVARLESCDTSDAYRSTDYAVVMAAAAADAAAAATAAVAMSAASCSSMAAAPSQHPAAAAAVELGSDGDADDHYNPAAPSHPATLGSAAAAAVAPDQTHLFPVPASFSAPEGAPEVGSVGASTSQACGAREVATTSPCEHHCAVPTSQQEQDDTEGGSVVSLRCKSSGGDADMGSAAEEPTEHAPPYAALESMIASLQSYSSLRCLILHHTDIGCNLVLCEEFGRALACHSHLEKLTLDQNLFCDDALAAVLNCMGGLSRLTELCIVESVAFESTAALAVVLPGFVSLRILSLTHFRPMFFDNPEGRALFQALAQVTGLEHLTMHSCHLNEVAAWCLADALRCLESLREVDFSSNELMGNFGVSQIARSLSKIPALEKINLNDVGATMRGLKTIAWCFKRHRAIQECWVCQRGFDHDTRALEAKRRKFRDKAPWMLLYPALYRNGESMLQVI